MDASVPDPETGAGKMLVYRHRLSTRMWHWTNAIMLLILLLSGLAIFNSHPRLYWGSTGFSGETAWLSVGSVDDRGYVRVGDQTFDTSGVLGTSQSAQGKMHARAFPYWSTLPAGSDLAMARRWHLSAAWLFAGALALYAVWSLFNGHLRRDLTPGASELRPRHLARACAEHAMLRFPRGAEATRYNILQKLSYLTVIAIMLPTMVLSGLAMSPAMNAAWPWLLDIFGGRQSARSVHFIMGAALVLFFLIHILMIALAGPWNHFRSMITGRYHVPGRRPQ